MGTSQENRDKTQCNQSEKMLKEDNSTKNASCKLIAQKLGRGRTSARKIIGKTDFRPLKHVATIHNSTAKRAKRAKLAKELLEACDGGARAQRVYWSD